MNKIQQLLFYVYRTSAYCRLFIEKWYWVPLTIANIVIIVTILIENRNPPKTLAWIMIIVLYRLSALSFTFFGRDFQREKYFKKIDKKQRQYILDQWKNLSDSIQQNMLDIENEIGDLSGISVSEQNQNFTTQFL